MTFLFSSCLQNEDALVKDFSFEKEYDPRVSLLAKQGQEVNKFETKHESLIPNKFTSRGSSERNHFYAVYESSTSREEEYLQFLSKKRADISIWGKALEAKEQP